MNDYYFSQIKFQLNEVKEGYESVQLIIKEQPGTTKILGKTRLAEASIFAKYGYVPVNQHLNRFICKKGSNVEITFKAKDFSHTMKAVIDFRQNNILFSSLVANEWPLTNNPKKLDTPTDAEIASTILESIYIGNDQHFTFFLAGRNTKQAD